MGWLINFLVELAGLVLVDEMKAWTPRLVQWLIQRATRNLPDNQRERFDEEWRSHVNDTPGLVGKLVIASGFLRASRTMSLELAQKTSPWRQRRRYMGVAAAVSVVALVTVLELKIKYEASTARLEDLVDQKDHDLKEKSAEAIEWARKYDDANTQLIDVRRQLEAKSKEATLVQTAQNEGNVTALQNLNLSGIPGAATPLSSTLITLSPPGLSGTSVGNASPIASAASSLSGTPFGYANPTLDGSGIPTANANGILTASAVSGPPTANASPITFAALSLSGTPTADANGVLTASSLSGTPGGIALPILTASALSGTLVGIANPSTVALTARATP